MALRSDGVAVAFADNHLGQCDVPELEPEASCAQVSAGLRHTVLLRSDGVAVAVGDNGFGQCDVLKLEPGMSYA